MRSLILCGLSALAIGLSAQGVRAAPVTYNVDEAFAGGSVTGTITTNGMLGTIPNFGLPPNQFFMSYDLTLTVGNDSTTLTSAQFGGPFGQNLSQALTATPTELDWNFGAARAGLAFEPGPNAPFGQPPCWELRAGAPALCGSGNTGMLSNGMVLAVNTSNFLTMPLSGTVPFATVGPLAETPEPGSLALLVSALAGMGLMRRRKRI